MATKLPALKTAPRAAASARRRGELAEFEQASRAVAAGMRGLTSYEAAEVGSLLTPLLLGERNTADAFLAKWRATTTRDRFEKARKIHETNSYVRDTLHLKEVFFNKGFAVSGIEAVEAGYDCGQLARDVWGEFLLCDNVVAFWREREEGEPLPLVTIFDCEQVEYSDAFGMNRVKFIPKAAKLDAKTRKALGPRYAEAIEKGKPLELSRQQGECWRVLKVGKRGKGLVSPGIYSVFEKLSALELLEIGDWAGAWTMKNVIRQIKKGHEIKTGNLAGQPLHFITKKISDAIKSELRTKTGAHDAVTNFDIDILYKFLDPRFFDAKKYDGILGRLKAWAGAAGQLLDAQLSPFVCEVLDAEMKAARGMVGPFLEGVLNDPGFLGAARGAALKVVWDEHAAMPWKIRLELIRLGYTNGLLSPQSAREMFGFDDAKESGRLLEAHQHPKQYWPPFEAKQGFLNNKPQGGRPDGGGEEGETRGPGDAGNSEGN